MRTTSAPRSPRIIAACGPGPMPANSTTRNPCSGPAMTYRPFVCSDAPRVPVRIFAAAPDGRAPRSLKVGRMPDSEIATLAPVAGLEVTLTDGVLSVTIDRPDSLNSLTTPVIAGLADTMERAAADPAVKVVRLGGAGRGFCSGAGIGADDMSGSGGVPPDEIVLEINRLIRADCRAAAPGRRRRSGTGRRRRRFARAGLRCRLGFRESLFHARVHQYRADARRRRLGLGGRRGRPHPGDADGAAARATARRRGTVLGPGQRGVSGATTSTPKWTR